MFKQKKVKYLTCEDGDKALHWADTHLKIVQHGWEKKQRGETFYNCAFLEETIVEIRITMAGYEAGVKPCTYIVRKDNKLKHDVRPMDIHKSMQRIYKYDDLRKDKEIVEFTGGLKPGTSGGQCFIAGPSPFRKNEPKYRGKWHDAYIYDIIKAHLSVFRDKLPTNDRSKYVFTRNLENDIVPEGCVGFMRDASLTLCLPGQPADIYMPLVDSPYKKYVDTKILPKMAKAEGDEKARLKQVINIAVGYLKHKNPFVYAYIGWTIRNKMRYFINLNKDKRIIYGNTDSLVSLEPLDGIPIGTQPGEFTVKHERFCYTKEGTQEEGKAAKINGVPTAAQGKGFDLAKDAIPSKDNLPYRLDRQAMRIVPVTKEDTFKPFKPRTIEEVAEQIRRKYGIQI